MKEYKKPISTTQYIGSVSKSFKSEFSKGFSLGFFGNPQPALKVLFMII